MGLLEWLKKPKYDLSPQEIEEKLQGAIIPEHARKKEEAQEKAEKHEKLRKATKPQRKTPIVIPGEKNIFFVESSFKLPPMFILNGYPRSGMIRRNMRAAFEEETILVKSVQSEFKRAGKLEAGQRGSIEITASLGLDIPENAELEFGYKTGKTKKTKRKLKRKKRKINAKSTEITPSKTMPLKPALAPLVATSESTRTSAPSENPLEPTA